MTSWKESRAARGMARGLVTLLERRERVAPPSRPPSACWALTGVRLWERTPDDARRRLAARMVVRGHAARAHVVLEDPGEHVHLLLQGGAKLYRTSARGRRFVEAILGPGDVCGRLATPACAETEAVALEMLEPTRIGAIPRADFDAVLRDRPDVALEVVQHLEDRARRLSRALEALAFKDVETRLAETLLALAHDHDEPCAHGFAVDVRLSQQDLAELVGASRQIVNRALGRFERRMLVQRIGRVICILELERLRRFAQAGA